jgi:hypothetical protein
MSQRDRILIEVVLLNNRRVGLSRWLPPRTINNVAVRGLGFKC